MPNPPSPSKGSPLVMICRGFCHPLRVECRPFVPCEVPLVQLSITAQDGHRDQPLRSSVQNSGPPSLRTVLEGGDDVRCPPPIFVSGEQSVTPRTARRAATSEGFVPNAPAVWVYGSVPPQPLPSVPNGSPTPDIVPKRFACQPPLSVQTPGDLPLLQVQASPPPPPPRRFPQTCAGVGAPPPPTVGLTTCGWCPMPGGTLRRAQCSVLPPPPPPAPSSPS